jgi:metallophosphoesterase superfamily enzyme
MNVIDPVGAINPTNILVLADWGVIRTTGFTPIFESLRNVMTNKSFKLMMINGDIAYNLDTNYGNNYMDFLKMAEEFISQIPVVFVPGNHENYTPDDQLLLN